MYHFTHLCVCVVLNAFSRNRIMQTCFWQTCPLHLRRNRHAKIEGRTKSLHKTTKSPLSLFASGTVTATFYATPPLSCIYDERRGRSPAIMNAKPARRRSVMTEGQRPRPTVGEDNGVRPTSTSPPPPLW